MLNYRSTFMYKLLENSNKTIINMVGTLYVYNNFVNWLNVYILTTYLYCLKSVSYANVSNYTSFLRMEIKGFEKKINIDFVCHLHKRRVTETMKCVFALFDIWCPFIIFFKRKWIQKIMFLFTNVVAVIMQNFTSVTKRYCCILIILWKWNKQTLL